MKKGHIYGILTTKVSGFEAYFGLTLPVVDMHFQGRISLEICEKTVDFNFNEVVIVDFARLYQEIYDAKNWGSTWCDYFLPSCGAGKTLGLYNALNSYRLGKGIKFEAVYTCPA